MAPKPPSDGYIAVGKGTIEAMVAGKPVGSAKGGKRSTAPPPRSPKRAKGSPPPPSRPRRSAASKHGSLSDELTDDVIDDESSLLPSSEGSRREAHAVGAAALVEALAGRGGDAGEAGEGEAVGKKKSKKNKKQEKTSSTKTGESAEVSEASAEGTREVAEAAVVPSWATRSLLSTLPPLRVSDYALRSPSGVSEPLEALLRDDGKGSTNGAGAEGATRFELSGSLAGPQLAQAFALLLGAQKSVSDANGSSASKSGSSCDETTRHASSHLAAFSRASFEGIPVSGLSLRLSSSSSSSSHPHLVLTSPLGLTFALERPSQSYRRVSRSAETVLELAAGLAEEAAADPRASLDAAVAGLARRRLAAAKAYGSAREALLLHAPDVVALIHTLPQGNAGTAAAGNAAGSATGAVCKAAAVAELAREADRQRARAAERGNGNGNGNGIHIARDAAGNGADGRRSEGAEKSENASETQGAAAAAAAAAASSSDLAFALALQARMDAEEAARSRAVSSQLAAAAARGGAAPYLRVSAAEVGGDYPPPKAYVKADEEVDELALADEELFELQPDDLPRRTLTDFSIYDAEGLLSTLELVPMWAGVDPDIELFASGVVSERGGETDDATLGAVPWRGSEDEDATAQEEEKGKTGEEDVKHAAEKPSGSAPGPSGSAPGPSSSAAGPSGSSAPGPSGSSSAPGSSGSSPVTGPRLCLSQIKEWVVEAGVDALYVDLRTDVAWYRLGLPAESYEPWFAPVRRAACVAARVLAWLAGEARASRLSFRDVCARLVRLAPSDPAFISSKLDRVERFVVVHGAILLDQLAAYPSRAVARSAFAGALRDRMLAVRHAKLYRLPAKKGRGLGPRANPLRDRAAGAHRAKPMTATATAMVRSVWQSYFGAGKVVGVHLGSAGGEEAKEASGAPDASGPEAGGADAAAAAAAAVAIAAAPTAKEVEEDENDDEAEEAEEAEADAEVCEQAAEPEPTAALPRGWRMAGAAHEGAPEVAPAQGGAKGSSPSSSSSSSSSCVLPYASIELHASPAGAAPTVLSALEPGEAATNVLSATLTYGAGQGRKATVTQVALGDLLLFGPIQGGPDAGAAERDESADEDMDVDVDMDEASEPEGESESEPESRSGSEGGGGTKRREGRGASRKAATSSKKGARRASSRASSPPSLPVPSAAPASASASLRTRLLSLYAPNAACTPRDALSRRSVGLVQALFQDPSLGPCALLRLVVPGSETILADAASDDELFLVQDALFVRPLREAAEKLRAGPLDRAWEPERRLEQAAEDAARRARNAHRALAKSATQRKGEQGEGEGEEGAAKKEGGEVGKAASSASPPAASEDSASEDPPELFYRSVWSPAEAAFRRAPDAGALRLGVKLAAPVRPHRGLEILSLPVAEGSAAEKDVGKKTRNASSSVPTVNVLKKDGVLYAPGDFAFFRASTFDRAPGAVRPPPELPPYLRGRFHKGSHDGLRAWGVARILEISSGKPKGGKGTRGNGNGGAASASSLPGSVSLVVERLYRPEDVSPALAYAAESFHDLYASSQERQRVDAADLAGRARVFVGGPERRAVDEFRVVGVYSRHAPAAPDARRRNRRKGEEEGDDEGDGKENANKHARRGANGARREAGGKKSKEPKEEEKAGPDAQGPAPLDAASSPEALASLLSEAPDVPGTVCLAATPTWWNDESQEAKDEGTREPNEERAAKRAGGRGSGADHAAPARPVLRPDPAALACLVASSPDLDPAFASDALRLSSSSPARAPPAAAAGAGAASPASASPSAPPSSSSPLVYSGKASDSLGPLAEADDGVALATMDIFAGCGGLSEGMHQARAAVPRWAVEYERPAADAFQRNNPETAVFCDNCNVLLHAAMSKAGLSDDCRASPEAEEASRRLPAETTERLPLPGDVEFICGGPPCQGYSGMNRFNRGNWSVVQNSMVMAFLSYADFYRPRYFLLENVRNFVLHNKSFTFRLTLRSLLEMGYQVRFGVLNAGNFGVAQSRKRTIIWAAAPDEELPAWPRLRHRFRTPQLSVALPGGHRFNAVEQIEHGAPLRPVTVLDAIGDLPPIENGHEDDDRERPERPVSAFQRRVRGTCDRLYDHVSKRMNALNLERCRRIPKGVPGADWRALEALVAEHPDLELFEGQPLVPWCLPHTADRHNGWRGLFGRLDPNGHFPTSTTDPQPMGKVGQVFHPTQDRIISVRECARAQGFPDALRFAGNVHARHRQVGNAVPPPLAFALGSQLRACLEHTAGERAKKLAAMLDEGEEYKCTA